MKEAQRGDVLDKSEWTRREILEELRRMTQLITAQNEAIEQIRRELRRVRRRTGWAWFYSEILVPVVLVAGLAYGAWLGIQYVEDRWLDGRSLFSLLAEMQSSKERAE